MAVLVSLYIPVCSYILVVGILLSVFPIAFVVLTVTFTFVFLNSFVIVGRSSQNMYPFLLLFCYRSFDVLFYYIIGCVFFVV
jgi:hypothetical protein